LGVRARPSWDISYEQTCVWIPLDDGSEGPHVVRVARGPTANKPLQQTNATRVRSKECSCRDAAGFARGSSRPWYA
jgi:hypothetical protein